MPDELNEMEVLAMAALYIPELARGVEGEVVIAMDFNEVEPEVFARVRNEIREAQITLYQAGWRQDRSKEKLAPFDFSCADYACYYKRFKPGQRKRWITVAVTFRFGLQAIFKGSKELIW